MLALGLLSSLLEQATCLRLGALAGGVPSLPIPCLLIRLRHASVPLSAFVGGVSG